MVYNEIIVFNFCDLGKDTKKFVEERLEEESNDLKEIENGLELEGLGRKQDNKIDDATEEDEFSHFSENIHYI